MEVKTKYNIGDIVFYLSESDQFYTPQEGKIKIVEGKIVSIHTNNFKSNSNVDYKLEVRTKYVTVNQEYVSKDIKELFDRVLKEAGENYRIKLDK